MILGMVTYRLLKRAEALKILHSHFPCTFIDLAFLNISELQHAPYCHTFVLLNAMPHLGSLEKQWTILLLFLTYFVCLLLNDYESHSHFINLY